MSALPSRSGVWRWLRGAATERLGLKAAALFFALVLWLVVRVREPAEELVPVRFQPVMDSSLALRSAPPPVSALVRGPAQELLKLYSVPPVVRTRVDADVGDELTVELRPGDVSLPAGVQAVVVDVQPRRLELEFAPTLTRRVPVVSDLRFTAAPGYYIEGSPRLEPDSVTIVGSRRLVTRVDSVSTVASDVVVQGSGPIVVPLDTATLGVRVRPAQVRVYVPVSNRPLRPDTVPADTAVRPGEPAP